MRMLAIAAVSVLAAVTSPAQAKLRIVALPKAGDGPVIWRTFVDLAFTTMAPGDETIVMNGPEGALVADIKLPDDPLLNRPERKARALAATLQPVKAFTDTIIPATPDTPAILNTSGLLDALAPILAAHGSKADILLWGSAWFTAPGSLMDKSYLKTFPSDGLIAGDRTASPVGTAGRRDLQGAAIYYCHTESAASFVGAEHEERVQRARSLEIGLRGGTLVAFSGDQKSCLDRFKTSAGEPITYGLDPDDIKVRKMYRPQDVTPKITDEVPIKSSAPVTRAPRADQRGDAARFDKPGRTTPPATTKGTAWLGIKWPDPIDLDVYARCSADQPFLFFAHQLSPEGRHNFDYRSGTGDAFETIDLTAPCANIGAAEVYVNFYSGRTSAPPKGVFAIQFDGSIYKSPFELQATDGNQGARTLFGGMTGPDWVKIDLPSVLHLKLGPGAQAAMRPGPLIKSAN